MSFDPTQLDNFPSSPGIYIMKNKAGKVLYVGKAKSLKKRLKQYFAPGRDARATIPYLLAELAHIDTLVVPTEKEALLLENTFIKKHQPKFNLILKDDKTYVSLTINPNHPWPMLRLIRYKTKPKDNALYFGPYTSAYAARQTFELMTRLFPLRQCSDEELKRRTRPCILYGIKRCIAPCVNKCSKEEYFTYVQGAIDFLKGNNKEILRHLHVQMSKASNALEFEKAAMLLKTIQQIEHVTQSDTVSYKSSGKDTDVIGLYREGEEVMIVQLFFRQGKLVGSEHFGFSQILEEEDDIVSSFLLQHYKEGASFPQEILVPIQLKEEPTLSDILKDRNRSSVQILFPQKGDKYALIQLAQKNAQATFTQEKDHQEAKEKILLDLQESLFLNRYPERIECFDTSNLSGSHLVASMAAFTDGEEDKKRTRYYHIKDIHKPDDYAALHQVLSRRLIRAKEEDDLPDLIIIDGGKGQLNIAIDVLKELDIANVDVISLAKEEGRHDKGITLERVFVPHRPEPISFPFHSQILFFLQKVRDAAHQKAVQFHRKTRNKKTLKSSLESIPGIGPIKKKRLLQHFGSLKRILDASDEELKKIPGMQTKDIENLRKMS
jgi:excinuclease ABC subunit C